MHRFFAVIRLMTAEIFDEQLHGEIYRERIKIKLQDQKRPMLYWCLKYCYFYNSTKKLAKAVTDLLPVVISGIIELSGQEFSGA